MRTRLLLIPSLILSLVGALVIAAEPASADEPTTPRFADVEPDAFYADGVEWAHELGVVRGVVEACFAPDRSATRAEVAAVLQRLVAPAATARAHPFADVTSEWQQVPVAWLAENDVTTGTSPTRFSPDLPATRAMIGAFLWRLEGEPTHAGAAHPFTDIRARWQDGPVQWLWSEGITVGRSPTKFAPDAPVTRGELLTFVWRWQGEPDVSTALGKPPVVDCNVATKTCADVFSTTAVAEINALANGRRVTATVHDHRTGCSYELNPGMQITTASVIKAQVLAGVLLDAQNRGVALSSEVNDRIELMMRFSHNSPPTSELYRAVGGATGMEELDRLFGLGATAHSGQYGATLTTAADRTHLVEQLLVGGGPLDAARVAEAWSWMSSVSVAQSWGLSAGLPADHDSALKNGFYPLSGRGWRLGTTGVVRAPSGTYAMTILTDGNANETSGIELVETVARHVNAQLALGKAAPRAVDSVVCTQTASGSSWATAGAALRVTDIELLRKLNGGESSPLSGQRVCAP